MEVPTSSLVFRNISQIESHRRSVGCTFARCLGWTIHPRKTQNTRSVQASVLNPTGVLSRSDGSTCEPLGLNRPAPMLEQVVVSPKKYLLPACSQVRAVNRGRNPVTVGGVGGSPVRTSGLGKVAPREPGLLAVGAFVMCST